MSFIRRIPVPMSALALGTAALGNLLLPYSPVARAVCGVIAATLVLLILARIVVDFRGLLEELKNPAALAVFPAFFMALVLLATYLKPFAEAPSKALWAAALVLQILVSLTFVVRSVMSFDAAQVLPSWFLVFVGFVTASVTSPAFGEQGIGQVLVYAGVIGYVAVLPLVVYRLVKVGDLPAPALPTVAIFAAPPSLCLVGYLAVTPAKDPAIIYVLLAAAAVSLVYLVARLPRILKARFCPACAALTFPVVISAIALKQSNAALAASAGGSFIPAIAVTVMDAFATLMVAFVLVRYATFLAVPVKEAAPATS